MVDIPSGPLRIGEEKTKKEEEEETTTAKYNGLPYRAHQ